MAGEKDGGMRTFIANDRGMRVYHRSDFGVRVGERIPPRFEIYNAPPRFVEIEPEFRRFKIVATHVRRTCGQG
jgi:hypothetical protein